MADTSSYFHFSAYFYRLLLWIMSSVFMPDEPEDIEIGLVNLDDSEPASMIVSALADSAEVAEGLEINEMTQAEAEEMIGDNTLVSYKYFPKFTDKMMRGESASWKLWVIPICSWKVTSSAVCDRYSRQTY